LTAARIRRAGGGYSEAASDADSGHLWSPAELCRIVIDRIVVNDWSVETIAWTPRARPFIERQRECPEGVSSTHPLSDEDPLAWYVA